MLVYGFRSWIQLRVVTAKLSLFFFSNTHYLSIRRNRKYMYKGGLASGQNRNNARLHCNKAPLALEPVTRAEPKLSTLQVAGFIYELC